MLRVATIIYIMGYCKFYNFISNLPFIHFCVICELTNYNNNNNMEIVKCGFFVEFLQFCDYYALIDTGVM